MSTAPPVAQGVELDAAAAAELAHAALALARRIAASATLWCVGPEWPEHARHLAVEFVHPVVVGKPALPAVSVVGTDPVAALRASARPGDVVAVLAAEDDGVGLDICRRAPAWGLRVVWIGAGATRPPADHVIAVGPDPRSARHDGRVVLRYHLLWELVHVCLEHPGLLADPGCDDEVCITCADEGRAAEVVAVQPDGLVEARTARGTETVDATLVGEVAAGDLLLVHAGTAIERLAAPDA